MMAATRQKERAKVKVHTDGNGGLYVKPEDVLADPAIRKKIKNLNEMGPMAKTLPKERTGTR